MNLEMQMHVTLDAGVGTASEQSACERSLRSDPK